MDVLLLMLIDLMVEKFVCVKSTSESEEWNKKNYME